MGEGLTKFIAEAKEKYLVNNENARVDSLLKTLRNAHHQEDYYSTKASSQTVVKKKQCVRQMPEVA